MNRQELIDLIKYHDDLYYGKGEPEITDAEYDMLRDQLTEAEADFVSGAPTGLFPKYTHSQPITSLSKVNTESDLRKQFKKLAPVIVMPKFDGLTLVKYGDSAIVTRGSGAIGDDITTNAQHFINPNFVTNYPIRGEAIIRKERADELNALRVANGEEEFKNLRNAAAGILRSKDLTYIRFLSYVTYDLVGYGGKASDAINKLSHFGFETTDCIRFELDEEEEFVDFVMNFNRDDYPYELDGLVIRSDIKNALEKFGETSHHPNHSFAYKFPTPSLWTKLIDVHWTIGRTGKVVPNAVYEPIELLGSTIQNATLHNPAYIESIGLSIGCDIRVTKANEIIPAVLESRKYNPLRKVHAPTNCPQCGSTLEKVKDQIFCRQLNCGSKLIEQAIHAVGKDALDIFGLSEQTIQKMIDLGYLGVPLDVLELTLDQIESIEGFQEKSAQNLYKGILLARSSIEFNRFLVSLSIPLIGRTASKQIAKVYKTPEALIEDRLTEFAKLKEIDGFGEKMIHQLSENLDKVVSSRAYFREIKNSLYGEAAKAEGAYNICVTGKFDQPRDYYQKLIEDAGHKFASSVSKKTTHLLAGEKAGSKLAKAEELGVPVLKDVDALLALLGE